MEHHALTKRKWTKEWLLLALLMIVLAPLTFYNLENYPVITGWDEGMYLDMAQNLVRHGEYATANGDKFERLMPPGGTGPTLILPVSLALAVSNGSLVAARLVIVLFVLTSLVIIYLLVKSISSIESGLLAIPFVLIAGYQVYDTLWIGRQILAEIPAFTFMLAGLLCWHQSWSKGWQLTATGGVFFGPCCRNKEPTNLGNWPHSSLGSRVRSLLLPSTPLATHCIATRDYNLCVCNVVYH